MLKGFAMTRFCQINLEINFADKTNNEIKYSRRKNHGCTCNILHLFGGQLLETPELLYKLHTSCQETNF